MSLELWGPEQYPRVSYMEGFTQQAGFADYEDLWAWSVQDPGHFWHAVIDFFGMEWDREPDHDVVYGGIEHTLWFPGGRLNYAAQALRPGLPTDVAVMERSARGDSSLTRGELRLAVAKCRVALQVAGVDAGDVVAGYLPNIAETIVAMLATASLGAVWTCCSPEYELPAVVARLGQLQPRVIVAADGYEWRGKAVDRRETVDQLAAQLTPAMTVLVPYLFGGGTPRTMAWPVLMDLAAAGVTGVKHDAVPFDHPLWVCFTSGTTGLPKPITVSHGGITLEHLKASGLHYDLQPGDRHLWYTTTGWTMWNQTVSALLTGATVMCFDGDPLQDDALLRYAGEGAATSVGCSPGLLRRIRNDRAESMYHLDGLRMLGTSGAPLDSALSAWAYDVLGSEVYLNNLSGGTDLGTAVLGGSPTVPVWAGELSCRWLGANVQSLSPSGEQLVGTEGEMVIATPMPSFPVGMWGRTPDALHDAYFSTYPRHWHHGDWITITDRGSAVISGRSDATLNRNGVRIGTAELYDVVESMPEVDDSLAVHLEGEDVVVLFVVPAPGCDVTTPQFRLRLAQQLRSRVGPRLVPDHVLAVPDVPRTHTGKRLEVPVKRLLQGVPMAQAVDPAAVANPAALDAAVVAMMMESTRSTA